MINSHVPLSGVVFAYGARDNIWPGIGTVLLKESGVIGDVLCRAECIIKSRLGWSLLETLRSKGPMQEFVLEPINTAVQLALTAAWDSRGIKPTAVLCRCGGEFAAVHAAGGLSFDDALDLACRVGSFIREGRGRGKMLYVRLSQNETKNLAEACPARFAVISEGAYDTTVIACDANDVPIIGDFFSKRKVGHGLCQFDSAPHSWMVESWKEGMLRPLQNPATCSIPIYSGTSQGRLPSNVDWTLHFWRVVREPVSIRSAIRSALDDGAKCFLEIGTPTLRDFITREAHARNLHVHSFATMGRLRSMCEVMNPTQAALTAVASRRWDDAHSAWPASTSSQTSVPKTNLEIDIADPYPTYARLRRMGPVLTLNWLGLERSRVVTRYRDVLTVFKDSRFVRNPVNCGRPVHHSPRRLGFGPDLLELDPPDHTRLRKLVSKAFTPQMVQRFDGRITQLAGQILDRAKSRGEIELISEYASVIPITIISELLGVPVDDIGKFRAFIYALSVDQMPARSDSLRTAKLRFTKYLQAVFAARRATPQDDLVSSLVNVAQDSDRLSSDELIGMVYLLLLTGFVTTVNLIGNGMLALLRHPEQLDMLRQNPALMDTAVEELLRFDSPSQISVICFASTEIELGGVQIPRGAPVRALIGSANRDEEQFPAPDTLDITRRPCPHLSFGQGIHHCIGAPLARLEGKIALGMLIERAPNLRLGDPLRIKWVPHPVTRGLQQLPLRF